MTGIYFSGTGNTKYCVEKFLEHFDGSKAYSIESPEVIEAIRSAQDIVLGYPIYFSNLPKIVGDFIQQNKAAFHNKRVFIICTMGLFSGDGAGCSARSLKKYGANIVGGLHIKMPDCIGDSKLLKKTPEQNKAIIKAAEGKIQAAAMALKKGKPPKNGLDFFCHAAGLFGQRLWFYNKTKGYSSHLTIHHQRCIGCGKCVELCPMSNLYLTSEKIISLNRCTMCYRCISHCPERAMTLLGKEVIEQSLLEKYL